MDKRWKVLQANEEFIEALRGNLGIHPVLCKILVQRGYDTFDKAKEFFRPKLSQLHSAWLMKDMEKAVNRIVAAMNSGEKILVYGDYDVDGTTSVASMYQFLKTTYEKVDYYIPHRYREGYGISKLGIDFAKENDFNLIISLDCGIKSVELISYASSLGVDFIVCDHHLPDQEIPKAVAILNPKQKDCSYPYKELCGCGVGFKLMTALAEKLHLPDESYLCFLDLLATAIAADIVPITDENRILAYYGLQQVNSNPSTGIKALMELAKVEKEMFITNLVFIIAPRVNAAGRMDDAKKAVQLFIEKDVVRAKEFAEILHVDNTERRNTDTTITEEAYALIENTDGFKNRKSTVLYQEHWHKGVVGIVASRLIETYYRPTIILTKSGDIAAGSARSVSGFNLYEAIHACREYLIGYGGHFAAAGMTLMPENIEAFSQRFEEVVCQTIHPDSLIPEIIIDAEIELKDITVSFFNILKQMEPFGPENMRPVFIVKNVLDSGESKLLKEQHIRFCVKQKNNSFKGIGFNMAEKFAIIEKKKPMDIVFSIDENEFNGNKTLQLKVIDVRLSEMNIDLTKNNTAIETIV